MQGFLVFLKFTLIYKFFGSVMVRTVFVDIFNNQIKLKEYETEKKASQIGH